VVNITFRSGKIQKIFNSDKELQKMYGKNCARKIRSRLDDLHAAPTLEALRNLPGRCHELKGDRQGQLSLDVEQPYRLIFEPAGEFAQKPTGGLDWSTVKAVQIIEVEDYHG
jgi:plasmid maintenance system killer protein